MKKLTFIVVAISLASCGQMANKNTQTDNDNRTNVSVPADWKTYTHDNYSVQYPANWTVKENQMGTIFCVLAPLDSADNNFDENVNLTTEDLKGKGVDLDKYTEISIAQLKSYITNDSVAINKREKDGKGEYQHIVFYGDQGAFHLVFEQWYRIVNDKAYVLTLTTLRGQWDKGHALGEQVMSTFMVK